MKAAIGRGHLVQTGRILLRLSVGPPASLPGIFHLSVQHCWIDVAARPSGLVYEAKVPRWTPITISFGP